MVVIGQKRLYVDKVVLFGQSDFVGVKWLYSGKSCCNRAKWLNSRKMVVLWAKLLYSGKSGCIRAK